MSRKPILPLLRLDRITCSFLILSGFIAACNLSTKQTGLATMNPAGGDFESNQQSLHSESSPSLDQVPLVWPSSCPTGPKGGMTTFYLCVNHSWKAEAYSGDEVASSSLITSDYKGSNRITFHVDNNGVGSKIYGDLLSTDIPLALTGFLSDGTTKCPISGKATLVVQILDGNCLSKDKGKTGYLRMQIKEEIIGGSSTFQCGNATVPIAGLFGHYGESTAPFWKNIDLKGDRTVQWEVDLPSVMGGLASVHDVHSYTVVYADEYNQSPMSYPCY
jgi:hypothetical protein